MIFRLKEQDIDDRLRPYYTIANSDFFHQRTERISLTEPRQYDTLLITLIIITKTDIGNYNADIR
jgi:hypothetical protein